MDKKQSGKSYKQLNISGTVQGVGFRPHVRRCAERHGITGEVRNLGGEVEILCGGAEGAVDAFIADVLSAPFPAQIERWTVRDITEFEANDFVIAQSGQSASARFVPSDIAMCPLCLRELYDDESRRQGHFFNTCTACGPRYTVIEALPYDRESTSMRDFLMCAKCAKEYTDFGDRRLKAETIACPDCGPRLFYKDGTNKSEGQAALEQAAEVLENGGIVAVKGLGGYHLACSPHIPEASRRLRTLKGRDYKPFAVMFPDICAVERHCTLLPEEREELSSPAAPIVLLPIKGDTFSPSVLNGDLYCGCMPAYTPLHKLLLDRTGELVMTSANPSGQGIITREDDIFRFLAKSGGLLSGVLYNNRRIVRSAEDSVVQFLPSTGRRILRRGRGFVPQPLAFANPSGRSIFAAGGDLKASFCLTEGDRAYMSPYIGDLEEADIYKRYAATAQDYISLFDIKPQVAVCDMHPGYFSSSFALGMGLPVIQVQHHHAHIAGVMAQEGLEGSVLGASLDGTGYGEDGAVWGGEFLSCSGGSYQRLAHLEYVRMTGGDAAARDASLGAACYMYAAGLDYSDIFADIEGILRAALDSGIGTVNSSSMGRLFDAVSTLLGICSENTSEGECAVMLQREAEKALRDGVSPITLSFESKKVSDGLIIGWHELVRQIYRSRDKKSECALGFHVAVCDMVCGVFDVLREGTGLNTAILSGGVFQNGLLMDMCVKRLRGQGFDVRFDKNIPPNDGGIALGQAFIAARRI